MDTDFATKLLRDMRDLRIVTNAFGQADVKTTAHHAYVDDEDVADALESLSKKRKAQRKNERS